MNKKPENNGIEFDIHIIEGTKATAVGGGGCGVWAPGGSGGNGGGGGSAMVTNAETVAIEVLDEGRPIRETAEKHGISRELVSKWVFKEIEKRKAKRREDHMAEMKTLLNNVREALSEIHPGLKLDHAQPDTLTVILRTTRIAAVSREHASVFTRFLDLQQEGLRRGY